MNAPYTARENNSSSGDIGLCADVWKPRTGDAVEVSVEKKPELILMDLRMPSVNGLLGTAALQSYNRLRVCTNYRGSGGLHFKSEKRSYIFVSSGQPFQSRC
jgi:CheY-like chemotaxis protein